MAESTAGSTSVEDNEGLIDGMVLVDVQKGRGSEHQPQMVAILRKPGCTIPRTDTKSHREATELVLWELPNNEVPPGETAVFDCLSIGELQNGLEDNVSLLVYLDRGDTRYHAQGCSDLECHGHETEGMAAEAIAHAPSCNRSWSTYVKEDILDLEGDVPALERGIVTMMDDQHALKDTNWESVPTALSQTSEWTRHVHSHGGGNQRVKQKLARSLVFARTITNPETGIKETDHDVVVLSKGEILHSSNETSVLCRGLRFHPTEISSIRPSEKYPYLNRRCRPGVGYPWEVALHDTLKQRKKLELDATTTSPAGTILHSLYGEEEQPDIDSESS